MQTIGKNKFEWKEGKTAIIFIIDQINLRMNTKNNQTVQMTKCNTHNHWRFNKDAQYKKRDYYVL